jgi:hypothetical protein
MLHDQLIKITFQTCRIVLRPSVVVFHLSRALRERFNIVRNGEAPTNVNAPRRWMGGYSLRRLISEDAPITDSKPYQHSLRCRPSAQQTRLLDCVTLVSAWDLFPLQNYGKSFDQ